MLSDWRRSRLTDSSEFWISVVHQFFNRNDFLVSSKVCTMYNILTLIYYYNTVTAFANIMFKLEYAKTNPLVGQGIDRCASASTYVILNLRSLYHLKKVIWLKVTVFDTELITFKNGFYQSPSISHLPRVSEWNIRMKVSNFIYLSACLNFRQNRRQFYIHSWYCSCNADAKCLFALLGTTGTELWHQACGDVSWTPGWPFLYGHSTW